jgi:hypothetical protein
MGFLDKIINGVNAAARPVQDLETELTRDRSLGKADDLAAQGATVYGTIVGIRRKLEESTERHFYAVDVPVDGATKRFGIEVMGRVRSRLRLGLPVIVRTDGDHAVLDLAAMCAAWQIGGGDGSQRSARKVPDEGIKDTALDMRVERHLKNWTRTSGTITAIERKQVLGMLTQNWDVHVQLADGTTTISGKDAVPEYAMWFAAPGTQVSVAVDPKNPARAAIDWPELAVRWGTVPAVFEQTPPEGSAAADVEAPVEATTSMSFGGAAAAGPTPVAGAPFHTATTNATIQEWVEGVRAGYMKPKAFHSAINDWESAGMCTHEEAEAARQAIL